MRKFSDRHIGISSTDEKAMLDFLGLKSLNHLIEQTIPKEIINNAELKLDKAISEAQYSSHIYELSQKNKYFKNYIGKGYNESILPPVIQRNILENPGWYTAYTPYQAEVAQGRLEALLNYQTVICDLTGMEISNASLLDEATSSLDAETENKIQEAINFLTKGRTTIVIAHRLSTILNADKIYVIDKGLVVGEGKHKDLVITSDIYKNFYEKQIKKQ